MELGEFAAMRRDRIEARLEALKIPHWTAAARAGKSPNFVYDFLEGRKKGFNKAGSLALAAALECSVEYLEGKADSPGEPPPGIIAVDVPGSGMVAAGVVEAGVWRTPAARPRPLTTVPVSPDPRYPSSSQKAYVMRGRSLEDLGIYEGDVLVSVSYAAFEGYIFEANRLVIVERGRPDTGEIEISARVVVRGRLSDEIRLETRSKSEVHEPIEMARNHREMKEPGRPAVIGAVLNIVRLL